MVVLEPPSWSGHEAPKKRSPETESVHTSRNRRRVTGLGGQRPCVSSSVRHALKVSFSVLCNSHVQYEELARYMTNAVQLNCIKTRDSS